MSDDTKDIHAPTDDSVEVLDTPAEDNPKTGSVTIHFHRSSQWTNTVKVSRRIAVLLHHALDRYLYGGTK